MFLYYSSYFPLFHSTLLVLVCFFLHGWSFHPKRTMPISIIGLLISLRSFYSWYNGYNLTAFQLRCTSSLALLHLDWTLSTSLQNWKIISCFTILYLVWHIRFFFLPPMHLQKYCCFSFNVYFLPCQVCVCVLSWLWFESFLLFLLIYG